MLFSIEGSDTCLFAELVEGEGFSHDGTLWIYSGTTLVHDTNFTIQKAHLLMVTRNGLVPKSFDLDEISPWEVQPLEVVEIRFAPSTIDNDDRQFM